MNYLPPEGAGGGSIVIFKKEDSRNKSKSNRIPLSR